MRNYGDEEEVEVNEAAANCCKYSLCLSMFQTRLAKLRSFSLRARPKFEADSKPHENVCSFNSCCVKLSS